MFYKKKRSDIKSTALCRYTHKGKGKKGALHRVATTPATFNQIRSQFLNFINSVEVPCCFQLNSSSITRLLRMGGISIGIGFSLSIMHRYAQLDLKVLACELCKTLPVIV